MFLLVDQDAVFLVNKIIDKEIGFDQLNLVGIFCGERSSWCGTLTDDIPDNQG